MEDVSLPKEMKKIRATNQVLDTFEKLIETKLISKKKIIRNCPKVLIDASLIIDVLLDRNSIFVDDGTKIMDLIMSDQLNGYITESGLKNIWELAKQLKGNLDANYLVIKLLNSFHLCKTDTQMITSARKYHLNSFETGIQVECAKKHKIDAIITLRYRDFLECGFENFFSPYEFLKSYSTKNKQLSKTASASIETQINHSLALNGFDEKEEETENILLFKDWKIEYFDLTSSISDLTSATVVIVKTKASNKDYHYSESAFGIGAIATLFSAFDKVIEHIIDLPNHVLDYIKISEVEEGVQGAVRAHLIVKNKDKKVGKFYIHTNLIKACFFAYVKAIKALYDSDCKDEEYFLGEDKLPSMNSVEKIVKEYKDGERSFVNSQLEKANLTGQNLSGIDLKCSHLSFSILENINLSQANLTEVSLDKAVIKNANLTRVILCRAKLNSSLFANSNLTGAEIYKADLTNADLTGANLTNADLTGANLTNADLTGANLTNADLTGANLTNADLKGLDLSKNTVLLGKCILLDTAMPEYKEEVYGHQRIERIIHFFEQFESNHYEIYAVHSNAINWWNDDLGKEFRKINQKLSGKGISIKRVFIAPEKEFSNKMKEIIEEQVNSGIEVRCLSEKFAENFNGFNLKETNLLVCKNLSEPKNSLTTTMKIIGKKREKSGYISFLTNDIKMNTERFKMIWEQAETYSQNLCSCGSK